MDRVAKIETVETSSLRRKNGGGWRIWLTPLRSTLGELVEISHRPGTYVEHDGRHTQTYIYPYIHTHLYNVHLRIRARTKGTQVLVNPLGVPLGFAEEVQDVFLTDMAISISNQRSVCACPFSDSLHDSRKMHFGIPTYISCTFNCTINQTLVASALSLCFNAYNFFWNLCL